MSSRLENKTPEEIGELRVLLGHRSSAAQRVRGLIGVGLPASQIARACDVSVSGLRNWATAASQPRPDSAIALDDLRAVVLLLLDQMAAKEVVAWLTSRDPKTRRRPIDDIAACPTEVLAAALDEALEAKLARDADGTPGDEQPDAMVNR